MPYAHGILLSIGIFRVHSNVNFRIIKCRFTQLSVLLLLLLRHRWQGNNCVKANASNHWNSDGGGSEYQSRTEPDPLPMVLARNTHKNHFSKSQLISWCMRQCQSGIYGISMWLLFSLNMRSTKHKAPRTTKWDSLRFSQSIFEYRDFHQWHAYHILRVVIFFAPLFVSIKFQ